MSDIEIIQQTIAEDYCYWRITWSDEKGVRNLEEFDYFEDARRFVEDNLLDD